MNNKIIKRIAKVIATNAISVDKNGFLATHTPFKNLKYTVSGREVNNPKIVSEEEIFIKYILEQQENHNFIVVQGENGSGKSHLIRWIKEKYENEIDLSKEALIFISRGQNTLKGTLEQIINSDVFDDEFRKEKLKSFTQANENLSESFLKTNIILQFAGAIKDDKSLEKRLRESIYEYLVTPIVQDILLKPEGPINRFYARLINTNDLSVDVEAKFIPDDFIIDIVTKKEISRNASAKARRMAENLNDIRNGKLEREKLSRLLNEKVEFVIQNCTNLKASDLKSVFEDLRVELKEKGKNLTLLIEDITSFTGIDKALVEVLVTENKGTEYNEKFCRIFSVIGVTNAYYKDNFPDNLKDRVTGRIIIENDLFLNTEEELCELAGRYINAINLNEEIIDKWVKNGAYSEQLPISSDNLYDWSSYYLDPERKISIFPFTSKALFNMYNGLNQKTARNLLNKIIKIVLNIYYESPENFIENIVKDIGEFVKIPGWREVSHEITLRRQSPDKFEILSLVFRIWGDGTIYTIVEGEKTFIGGIDKSFFEIFGLPIINGVCLSNKLTKDKNENKGTSNAIKSEGIDVKEKSKSSINTLKVTNSVGKNTVQEDKNTIEFKKAVERLDSWFNQGEKFKDIQIKEQLIKFIINFIDWDAEDIPRWLMYENINLNKIAIEDQNTMCISGAYELKKSYELKDALVAVAAYKYLGKNKWNFDNSEVYLLYLTNFIESIKNSIIKYIKYPPENIVDANRWNIDKWEILTDIYINFINGNIKLEDKEDIYKIYEAIMNKNIICNYDIKSVDEDSRTKVIRKLMKDENINKNHENLINRYNCVLGDNRALSSDVFFIDTYRILKNIDDMIDINFDENQLDIPKIKVKDLNRESGLYLSYFTIKLILDSINEIVKEEEQEANMKLKELKLLLGQNFEDEIFDIFGALSNYLILLENSKESYDYIKFKDIKNNKLNDEDFMNIKENIDECLDEYNKINKLIKFSETPINKINPYITLFKNADNLVDTLIRKYGTESKNSDIKSEIDNIGVNINMNLENIKTKLNG